MENEILEAVLRIEHAVDAYGTQQTLQFVAIMIVLAVVGVVVSREI